MYAQHTTVSIEPNVEGALRGLLQWWLLSRCFTANAGCRRWASWSSRAEACQGATASRAHCWPCCRLGRWLGLGFCWADAQPHKVGSWIAVCGSFTAPVRSRPCTGSILEHCGCCGCMSMGNVAGSLEGATQCRLEHGRRHAEEHIQLQLRPGLHLGEATISVCLPALAPCHVMLRSPSKFAGSSRAACFLRSRLRAPTKRSSSGSLVTS